MITFETGIDARCRLPKAPEVARFVMHPNCVAYCVIGTQYGYWHTTGGDVRTWRTYSGARRALKRYVPI